MKRNRELFHARNGVRWVITLHGEDTFIGSCGHWRLMKEHYRAGAFGRKAALASSPRKCIKSRLQMAGKWEWGAIGA